MTQAPGSCDKPLVHDNKQRQTNPETLPQLAGLQAAQPPRQGAGAHTWGHGSSFPSTLATRLPRSHPALGCFSQRDAVGQTRTPTPAAVTAQMATRSPVAPQPPLTAEPSQTHHTSVPQPRPTTPNPTLCSCTGRFGAGHLGIIPAFPGKRRGWTIHKVPLSPRISWFYGCMQMISSGSCSPAVWCAAPSQPSRKTLGNFSPTATLVRVETRKRRVASLPNPDVLVPSTPLAFLLYVPVHISPSPTTNPSSRQQGQGEPCQTTSGRREILSTASNHCSNQLGPKKTNPKPASNLWHSKLNHAYLELISLLEHTVAVGTRSS